MKENKYLSAKLKHKINILQATEEAEWIAVNEAYAEIMSVSETSLSEFDGVSFGHIMAEEYFIITCRYIKNMNCRMRISFGDRIFTIKRIINPYELNHFLKFLVLEITEN